jgi:RNA polymerase sigma-70 factor, ECF subfamily
VRGRAAATAGAIRKRVGEADPFRQQPDCPTERIAPNGRISFVNADPVYLADRQEHGTPFERLVRRHHARLRRFASAMLIDRGRVDDVLQEAYIKAFRSEPRFANEAHELAWLQRVVYRCCIDELRRAKRRRETPVADVLEHGSAPEPLRRTLVDEAWRALSDNDRAVLLLVDVAGFDYTAAARILRVPRGTVASRLSVARDRLRGRMEDA